MNKNRNLYIYSGNCKKCGKHKPVNYLGYCQPCDQLKDPTGFGVGLQFPLPVALMTLEQFDKMFLTRFL